LRRAAELTTGAAFVVGTCPLRSEIQPASSEPCPPLPRLPPLLLPPLVACWWLDPSTLMCSLTSRDCLCPVKPSAPADRTPDTSCREGRSDDSSDTPQGEAPTAAGSHRTRSLVIELVSRHRCLCLSSATTSGRQPGRCSGQVAAHRQRIRDALGGPLRRRCSCDDAAVRDRSCVRRAGSSALSPLVGALTRPSVCCHSFLLSDLAQRRTQGERRARFSDERRTCAQRTGVHLAAGRWTKLNHSRPWSQPRQNRAHRAGRERCR
jgi:hypothetical protein